MRIGVIVGSVREGRVADQVASWVLEHAAGRGDADFVRVDLKDFALPVLTEPTAPSDPVMAEITLLHWVNGASVT